MTPPTQFRTPVGVDTLTRWLGQGLLFAPCDGEDDGRGLGEAVGVRTLGTLWTAHRPHVTEALREGQVARPGRYIQNAILAWLAEHGETEEHEVARALGGVAPYWTVCKRLRALADKGRVERVGRWRYAVGRGA